MHLSSEEENISLSKFESMLKTNDILFFDSDEFENIIHHYLENGKISRAKRAIKFGLQQHPSSINLKLFEVETLILENNFKKADEILAYLHNLEPTNEEIYIQKANVLSKQDKHKEAIETLLIAIELSNTPDSDSDLYALIGMEYLFIDAFENAITYFKKCLEIDHTDYSALHNIIYCFDFLEKNQEAVSFLTAFLDKNPYCEVAWHQLGQQYVALKKYKKAYTAFDFAIIADDTFVGAYIEKGKILEKQKKYEAAIENYKITLALEDPTSYALLRIGHCYDKLKNDELALHFYTKTVEEDPLLDKGWIAITKFYMKRLDYENALSFSNKSVSIDPENVAYWKLYATVNKRLNYLEEAEYAFKRVLDLGNFELETWLHRTDILIALKEYQTAIFNLIQALEFFPENAEIEYRLSGLYFKTKHIQKGCFHLKNGLCLDAEYSFIISELFPQLKDNPKIQAIILNFNNSKS